MIKTTIYEGIGAIIEDGIKIIKTNVYTDSNDYQHTEVEIYKDDKQLIKHVDNSERLAMVLAIKMTDISTKSPAITTDWIFETFGN